MKTVFNSNNARNYIPVFVHFHKFSVFLKKKLIFMHEEDILKMKIYVCTHGRLFDK